MPEEIWRGDVRTAEDAARVASEAYRLLRSSYLRLEGAREPAVEAAMRRAHTSADRADLERAARRAVDAEVAALRGAEAGRA